MKAIKNITDTELHKEAKKKKNTRGKDAGYTEGYIDGSESMRQKAVKENSALRDKIMSLKAEIVKYRRDFLKMAGLAKKLATKLEESKDE